MNLLAGIVAAGTLLAMTSCSKRGCMDNTAQNFEPKATVDCGCCNYVGKVLVWYREPFYRNVLEDLKRAKLYANEEFKVENSFLLLYQNDPPDIPADYGNYANSSKSSHPTVEVFLGEKKQKKFKISMKAEDGRLLWEDSVLVHAAKVIPVEAH